MSNLVEKTSKKLKRRSLLIDFLFHLNSKGLINNHDFEYEKEAKKYLKSIKK